MFEVPECKTVMEKKDVTWYCCPHCGQKVFKVYPGARVSGIQIKCKGCKTLLEVRL